MVLLALVILLALVVLEALVVEDADVAELEADVVGDPEMVN